MDAYLVYGNFNVSIHPWSLNPYSKLYRTTSLLGLYAIIELSKLATVSAFTEYERLCQNVQNTSQKHLMCYIDIDWLKKHW